MEKEKMADMKLIKKEQQHRHYNPELPDNGGGYDWPHYVYAGTIAGQKTEVDISDMSCGKSNENWTVQVKSNGKRMGCFKDDMSLGMGDADTWDTCMGIHNFSKEYRDAVTDWLSKEHPQYGKVMKKLVNEEQKKNEMVTVLDVETTGNKADDEVLRVTMVNANGDKLFEQSFKPEHKTTWEKTENTALSPEDVKDKPSLKEYKETIEKELKSAGMVVGYGTGKDMKMLEKGGIRIPQEAKYVDLQNVFGYVMDDKTQVKKSKVQSLGDCAGKFGYDKSGKMLKDDRIMVIKYCFNEMSDLAYVTNAQAKEPKNLRGYDEKKVIKARKAEGKEKRAHGIHRKSSAREHSR